MLRPTFLIARLPVHRSSYKHPAPSAILVSKPEHFSAQQQNATQGPTGFKPWLTTWGRSFPRA